MRSGVRRRPSRSGSSPSRSSSSRSNSCVVASDAGNDDSLIFFTTALDFTNCLLITDFPAPGVFKGIEHSLFDTDFVDLCMVKVSFQYLEDLNTQVFRGRHRFLKFF